MLESHPLSLAGSLSEPMPRIALTKYVVDHVVKLVVGPQHVDHHRADVSPVALKELSAGRRLPRLQRLHEFGVITKVAPLTERYDHRACHYQGSIPGRMNRLNYSTAPAG